VVIVRVLVVTSSVVVVEVVVVVLVVVVCVVVCFVVVVVVCVVMVDAIIIISCTNFPKYLGSFEYVRSPTRTPNRGFFGDPVLGN
jgi:hypothetical protein